MLSALASGVYRGTRQSNARRPDVNLRMDDSGRRARVETNIVVGDIAERVLAPEKSWFQKVLDAAPTRMLNDELRPQRESNFMITIQTNYKPRNRAEGKGVQTAFHKGLDALFNDDQNLARCIRMGVYPDKANPKRFDFRRDTYDTHIEHGEAKIGIEYGPQSGRLHAHILLTLIHYSRVQFDGKRASDFLIDYMRAEGKGDLPNFYKEEWFGEQEIKASIRPTRKRDREGMVWQTKGVASAKRSKAKQMHVDVKLLPQSNLQDLLKLYITKTAEALESGAFKPR